MLLKLEHKMSRTDSRSKLANEHVARELEMIKETRQGIEQTATDGHD